MFPKKEELDFKGLAYENAEVIASTKGLQKFLDIAVSSRGKLWGVTLSHKVIYYSQTNKKWYDAKFPKMAVSIAAGPMCHTYVLGYPLG